MKIAILVEGATEMAFRKKLHEFLQSRLEQKMPKLRFIIQNGGIPKEGKLKLIVENLLDNDGYNAVIALTDVYTGKPDFKDANDAKDKMRRWVGKNPKFYPHIKSVSIGIVNSSSRFTALTVNCSRRHQSTVNSQHHSGVTGNDITQHYMILKHGFFPTGKLSRS